MNNYYVYLHKTKDGTPFYVGKGKGNRAYSTKRSSKWINFVNVIGEYDIDIAYNNLSEEDALKIEKKVIAKIGLDNLTNILAEGYITYKNNPYQYMYDTADELISLANITMDDINKDKQIRSYLKMLGELYKLQDEFRNKHNSYIH
jgi:hypothetical protein